MAELELACAALIQGEARVFPVQIELGKRVYALHEAIAGMWGTERRPISPVFVTVRLARKHGKWLRADCDVERILRGKIDKEYQEMWTSWRLHNEKFFGLDFKPNPEEIQVLVELPADAREKLCDGPPSAASFVDLARVCSRSLQCISREGGDVIGERTDLNS